MYNMHTYGPYVILKEDSKTRQITPSLRKHLGSPIKWKPAVTEAKS